MRSTAQLLTVALLLLCAPTVGAVAGEFEGIGEVPIVGGNQVSARKRAILSARRDAVSKAVAGLLPQEKVAELEQGLRRDIYARAELYVHTYRVLEETQQAGRFRVKIAARVLVSRLRQDLTRLAGGDIGSNSPDQPTRVAVRITFGAGWPEANRAGARAATRKLLQARGLRLEPAAPTDSPVDHAPGTEVMNLLLDAPERQTIRGTAWPAVRVSASLSLATAGAAAPTAASKASAWGASGGGSTLALNDALARAVIKALSLLRRNPAARAALDRVKPGWVQVWVSGITSPRQARQLRQVICDEVSGGGRCQISGVGQGQLRLSAETRQRAKALGNTLDGRRLEGGLQLSFNQERGGRLWLELIQAPPEEPLAPDAGVPDVGVNR